MTKADAAKVVALLSALFCGRMSEESMRAWMLELEEYKAEDAIAGVREHGRTADHPSLRECIECIERHRNARALRERQRLDRLALPAQADPDPEQQARCKAARDAAIAQVLKRVSIDAPRPAEEPKRIGPNGHETMTPAELEERKRRLREMAEQLEQLEQEGA